MKTSTDEYAYILLLSCIVLICLLGDRLQSHQEKLENLELGVLDSHILVVSYLVSTYISPFDA